MVTVLSRYGNSMVTVWSRYDHGMVTVCKIMSDEFRMEWSRFDHGMVTEWSRWGNKNERSTLVMNLVKSILGPFVASPLFKSYIPFLIKMSVNNRLTPFLFLFVICCGRFKTF